MKPPYFLGKKLAITENLRKLFRSTLGGTTGFAETSRCPLPCWRDPSNKAESTIEVRNKDFFSENSHSPAVRICVLGSNRPCLGIGVLETYLELDSFTVFSRRILLKMNLLAIHLDRTKIFDVGR